ncbi:hypothetical protein SDC9_136492 [bioreactor metagenome]|uniref:Uncharacterized protein n=1 Tax=bioreactor metagenome TaxID=1076179 RepID=A0A645DKN8_9ZZZZ
MNAVPMKPVGTNATEAINKTTVNDRTTALCFKPKASTLTYILFINSNALSIKLDILPPILSRLLSDNCP